MARMLWVEDFPHASENRIFLARLRSKPSLGNLRIEIVQTVGQALTSLNSSEYDVIVVDVMLGSAPRGFQWVGIEGEVAPSLTGIALLQHCTSGSYGPRNKQAALFVRTARRESFIDSLAKKFGAVGVHVAGIDDEELIAEIEKLAGEPGVAENGE